MKTILGNFIALVVVACSPAFGQTDTHPLKIEITNIKNVTGKIIFCGLYRKSDNFPSGEGWKSQRIKATDNKMTVVFDVPYDEYAIAISHDINGDGKLNTNLFGYPKEPFGFSKNFTPKLGSPKFADCIIPFKGESRVFQITLID